MKTVNLLRLMLTAINQDRNSACKVALELSISALRQGKDAASYDLTQTKENMCPVLLMLGTTYNIDLFS